jgi:hypothetical protein
MQSRTRFTANPGHAEHTRLDILVDERQPLFSMGYVPITTACAAASECAMTMLGKPESQQVKGRYIATVQVTTAHLWLWTPIR